MSRVADILSLVRRARGSKRAAADLPAEEEESAVDTEEPHVPVGLKGVIAATSKLLAVNRGLTPVDDRDSWEFKRVMTPDKMMAERVRMDASKMRRKLSRYAAKHGNLRSVLPFAFDEDVQGLLIGSSLSAPLEEINPVHILEQARRVTLMGPGGVGSSNAVTPEMQAISGSQFGFIDPLAGPESESAGIDTRLATGVRLGSDGRIYQKFRDRRNGGRVWLSPDRLSSRVVRLPD